MATTDVSLHAESRQPEQKPRRQQHEYPGRDRERIRLAKFQHGSVAQHFPDGSSGLRQESVSFEYCRTAHLVHHSRQQRRLHRAQEGNRFRGRHESRDRAGRRDVARPRRGGSVRRASESQHASFRPDFLRRALRQAGRARLSRGQAAQAGQEHDLRGRGGPVARDRHWPKSRRPSASSLPRR